MRDISIYKRECHNCDLKPEIAHKLIEQLIDYPYLQVQTYSKRRYLFDDVAAHSIGYVKKISEKSMKN